MSLQTSIAINRPARVVFEALTNPQEVVRHFPIERAEIEPHVGGRYDLYGAVDGQAFVDLGVIERFEPDRALGYRYTSSNHQADRSDAAAVHIIYELTEEAAGVRLSVEQLNLPSEEYGRNMEQVWAMLLTRLKTNLEDSGPP